MRPRRRPRPGLRVQVPPMRLCTAADCGRPAHHDLTICVHCTWTLEQALAAVPDLVAELDVTLARQSTGAGGRGTFTRALGRTPLPIALHALVASDKLHRTLDRWAVAIHLVRPLSTTALAAALLGHLHAIAKRDDAAQAVEDIVRVVASSWHAIDRPADRAYAGRCDAPRHDLAGQACPEHMYTKPGQDTVTCRACGATHDPYERRARMQDDLDGTLMTGAQIARLAAYFGHCDRERARNLIKVWAGRGLITAHGHTPPGDPLYPFGEVLSRLLTARSRQAAG